MSGRFFYFFFFKQKTAYEMRISDWSSDVCSSDLLPNIGFSVQQAAIEKGIAKDFPLILTSGRLVEYEGGGEETRSNRWLDELQLEMFVEINTGDAAERGIRDGTWEWVKIGRARV